MKISHSVALFMHCISAILAIFAPVALFAMQARPVSADSPSYVRIVHASPDIATTDVFLDGKVLLSTFTFATITNYATIPAGPHKVQAALIGRGPNPPAISQSLSVNPGLAYTVVAIGTRSTGLSLEVFVDDNQLSRGMAEVRVYHLSPGTGTASVSTGTKALISGLGYQQASNYLTFPAGSYTLNVMLTQPGTTIPVSVTLQANTVTSIFIVNDLINGTPTLRLVTKQVPGLPGAPETGSNSGTASGNLQPLIPRLPWVVGVLVLIVIGVGLLRFAPMLVKTNTHPLSPKLKSPVAPSLQGPVQANRFNKAGVLILILLALLAVLSGVGVGASIWFYASQHSAISAVPSSGSQYAGPSPQATATPQPTVTSTPVTGTSPYTTLARVYVGTMRDIPMGVTAKISLTSIQQQQGNIAGSFNTPENNLFGQIPRSGPFQGTITTSKEIQFTLMGDTGQATFSFDGLIQVDGSIQGTYCSLAAAAGKCSDYGVWNVSPST